MKDEKKTKAQLIADIAALRQEVATLKASDERHRQPEEALRDSERRFRELADLLPQTVFEITLDGNLTFTNRCGFEAFGYTQEDVDNGLNNLQLFIPEEHDRLMENTQRILHGEETHGNEYTARRKDGRTFPVIIFSSPIVHGSNTVGIRGIVVDNTERKQMEEALRKSEGKYRFLIEQQGEGIGIVTPDERFAFCNPAAEEIFGVSPGKLVGRNLKDFTDQRAFQTIQKQTEKRRRGDRTTYEIEIIRPDGDKRQLLLTASPWIDESGNYAGTFGIFRDQTERKRAEQNQLVLHNIAAAANIAEDLKELFNEIQKELGTIVDTTNFYIALYDKESDTISLPHMSDDKDEFTSFPAGKTLTSYVIKKGEPLLATEEVTAKLEQAGEVETIGTPSKVWLGVPLKMGKEIIGAMAIQSYTDASVYSEKDLEVLQFASGQIAIAIGRKLAEEKLIESEEKFRTITNTAKDAVIMIDDEGNISHWNPAAEEIFGYMSQEAIGKELHVFLAPERYNDAYRKGLRVFRESGQGMAVGQTLELEAIRKDGTEFPIELSLSAIRLKGQWHAVGIARDISERKQAEKALRESKDMLSALLNATDDAAFLADNKGSILIHNDNFAKRFGKGAGEFVGTNYLDMLSPQLAKARGAKAEEIIACGKPIDFEDERDGRILHVSCYPICDKQGNVEKIAVFSRDITESKQAEQTLKESEERFRTIFDNAMDGVLLSDAETKKFHTANKMMCKMLGYSLEELKTLEARDIHPEEALPYVFEQYEKQLHGEITLAKDVPVKRKDGSFYYADINSSPIVLGGKTYLMGIFRDITERKESEQELRKFKTISDKAGYGSAISDLKGNLIYINESFARMHGYSPQKLIGRNLSVFHNDEQMKEVVKLNRRLLEEGSYIAEEVWHKKKDGAVFPTLMTASLMKDDSGKPLFLTATAIDITERKQAQARLRQLERERAEIEKLAATGRMAARVAHEINNPLAGIKNSFQLIKSSVPKEHKYYDYVGLIDREIDRIARIVRGMIDLHRPIDISPRRFQIRDTIREVAELLESGLQEHEVSIQMEGIPTDIMVTMPEDYLRQILYNILKNATEASPQKGVVKVNTAKDDKMLTITISDQGSGIPKEETSKIFEPFFTTKSSRESGGLGLGLAISRGLVDVMGGSLDFDSSAEQGTIFRIVLPVDTKRKDESND